MDARKGLQPEVKVKRYSWVLCTTKRFCTGKQNWEEGRVAVCSFRTRTLCQNSNRLSKTQLNLFRNRISFPHSKLFLNCPCRAGVSVLLPCFSPLGVRTFRKRPAFKTRTATFNVRLLQWQTGVQHY